jgi:hypothetical protein
MLSLSNTIPLDSLHAISQGSSSPGMACINWNKPCDC